MTEEYNLIKRHYGDRTAERSGIPLINHIDEGLRVLKHIKADHVTQKAWCLHPLVQSDRDLSDFMKALTDIDKAWPTMGPQMNIRVAVLAMEYRAVANACLSPMGFMDHSDIKLSCLPEVNQMLIADKIQNYKDFAANQSLYPNEKELEWYFHCWHQALGIIPSKRIELIEVCKG